MSFGDNYDIFKYKLLKIINTKKDDNYILSDSNRHKILDLISETENKFYKYTYETNDKIIKLDTAIYIENSAIEDKMNNINIKFHEDIKNIENKKDEEINVILKELNDDIRKANEVKSNIEKEINNEINHINESIKLEISAYDSNERYYNTLIEKAAKRYDDYNSIIFNKIINIDINQPKTPKFNAQHDKLKKVIDKMKYFKRDNVSSYDVSDGEEFALVMSSLSDPIDDVITSVEENALFQTRIDDLNLYLDKLNKNYTADKNALEKIKHEVSIEYNKQLYKRNVDFNEKLASSKGNNERKLKSIDKRIDKQKKDYSDESARISEEYVSHITNISNEINNLDKENKRLIDNYNREYYFTYYKTLFEYNSLVSSIKDKTAFNSDQKNKYEQKRLDNFEIKSYQQKLKSLKLKHDKYIETLNHNIIQQINHNNYEITESNLYKLFDLTTSKIKHESFIKKSRLLKENIEKTSTYQYKISSIKHDNDIINLRYKAYDDKRQELDYELEKMELEHHARRDKIEKKIEKYRLLKDEYLKFVESDDNLIKAKNDSKHNTKLTVYYFEIRKNNILKEYNKAILELAKQRAKDIKDYRIKVFYLMINKLKYDLLCAQDINDYKLSYYSSKFNYKQQFIDRKYEAKINICKNEYNRKKNIKAVVFERNTFRHDNLKSSHYSNYVFDIYSTSTLLHMNIADLISDHSVLLEQLNRTFINFYISIVKDYYENEKTNLETRLNNIYYYKNSVSVKKLLSEKADIILKYDKKINALQTLNDNYNEKLNIFNSNSELINIKKSHIRSIKRALVKDIKKNNISISKLKIEENDKIQNIENIIQKNKKSSIIHYQNYQYFKKTMLKNYNSTIKNINNLEHKSKNKDIILVLEEHRTYVASLKIKIFKIFKKFTKKVESEFPKENQKINNSCNHLQSIYTNNETKAISIYDKQYNKLNSEHKKNINIPVIKQKHYLRSFNFSLNLNKLRHKKRMNNYNKKIKLLQNNLINNEIQVSNLITSIQTNNEKLIRQTEEIQKELTDNYISTISKIKLNYINNLYTIDRNKKLSLKLLEDKYSDMSKKLKLDKDEDISKCNKESRYNTSKLNEIQRLYQKNLSNIDADSINDRVDQQILLSQKLKKLKRLFIHNKDLTELNDTDYQVVSLSNYDDINNKLE